MKLIVRGFKKTTLAKHPNVAEEPIVAIGKQDRGNLGIAVGETITVAGKPTKVVAGKNGFVSLTKSLRKSLGVEKGQIIEITKDDNNLFLLPESNF